MQTDFRKRPDWLCNVSAFWTFGNGLWQYFSHEMLSRDERAMLFSRAPWLKMVVSIHAKWQSIVGTSQTSQHSPIQ
jgi:hypothetical protein